eukprot:CAMPEP_0116089080 /NCGR_PEP_ID=MMETSP0327-20121206/6237_1 /TAXON_ID=44447 /ORGANISM="Pseudo-nitzschia delicatissima, Strain B596" /LENGTH=38 /DNA_ID= /DNA_START= /DNA_END= /DNA_ORIENTATION=
MTFAPSEADSVIFRVGFPVAYPVAFVGTGKSFGSNIAS